MAMTTATTMAVNPSYVNLTQESLAQVQNTLARVTQTYDPITKLKEEIERLTEAHINISKNQDDRICELESVVGELRDVIDGWKKKAWESNSLQAQAGIPTAATNDIVRMKKALGL